MPKQIVVEAPAKINLILDVKGKRSDGYHEIETVMHQINLTDRVGISVGSSNDIEVISDSNEIPQDENNLAYKAAKLYKDKYGIAGGIKIAIKKNIPIGAGLAGGSTDAAAVLIGLNKIFKHTDVYRLADLGTRIGSDVPFCVWGGTALATGRGEKLSPLLSRRFPYIVLVKPKFEVSTAWVYGKFQLNQATIKPDMAAFVAAWNKYDNINIAKEMENVLESVTLVNYPEIADIKCEMNNLGAIKSLMSGSGSSVFGIFTDYLTAFNAVNIFKTKYKEVFLTSSYYRGDK